AQQRLGVKPDLTILGKALGAGFPISAVCGRADVMEMVSTAQVAHVGTFNANPICTSAALAAVISLERDAAEVYPRLEERGDDLAEALSAGAAESGLAVTVNNVGAAAHAFVAERPVRSFADLEHTDDEAYRQFAAALLAEGVHVIPRGL